MPDRVGCGQMGIFSLVIELKMLVNDNKDTRILSMKSISRSILFVFRFQNDFNKNKYIATLKGKLQQGSKLINQTNYSP